MKKTRFPHWNEGFTFELTKPLNPSASVQFICNDWDRMSHNDFLGQVNDVCICVVVILSVK